MVGWWLGIPPLVDDWDTPDTPQFWRFVEFMKKKTWNIPELISNQQGGWRLLAYENDNFLMV